MQEHRNPEAEELIKREQDCHVIAKMLAPGKRVTLQSFFFVDIQSLCHIPHKPDHKYIPCEVGVVRYTLNEGIVSKFHKFIKPGVFVCVSQLIKIMTVFFSSTHTHTYTHARTHRVHTYGISVLGTKYK